MFLFQDLSWLKYTPDELGKRLQSWGPLESQVAAILVSRWRNDAKDAAVGLEAKSVRHGGHKKRVSAMAMVAWQQSSSQWDAKRQRVSQEAWNAAVNALQSAEAAMAESPETATPAATESATPAATEPAATETATPAQRLRLPCCHDRIIPGGQVGAKRPLTVSCMSPPWRRASAENPPSVSGPVPALPAALPPLPPPPVQLDGAFVQSLVQALMTAVP